MTKYTFSLKNNPSTFNCPFYGTCNKTDYSKVLDDLINADIADKNPWLFGNNKDDAKINIKIKPSKSNLLGEINSILNKQDDYKKYIVTDIFDICDLCNMYEKKKLYKTSTGNSFMILNDSILINGKMFFFDDLNDDAYINALDNITKKTIATIYVAGLKITIKK